MTERPIADAAELVQHFTTGEKSPTALAIGMEHEKIAVLTDDADGRAPDYAKVAELLDAMATRGWERRDEGGQIIALARPQCGTITLEPGGQIEHSGAPWATAAESVADNDKHLDQLIPLAEAAGMTLLGVGFRPFGTLDDVPWMPKGRYRVMRKFLAQTGKLSHDMMKRTATVQANLDYTDEADAMQKLRVGLGLSSIVTALFAASPIVDGKPSGYQSFRAATWLDMDPARCGLLPFLFKEGARFSDYAEWALDVPMFFVYRHGEYREVPHGFTFRRFMAEGFGDERATPGDWDLHLSTLFPEARLRRYVEVRQADASTRRMVRALPPLWRGLLYDADARAAAWALVADWTMDERWALYQATPQQGLKATIRGRTLRELGVELVGIAKAGLLRLSAPEGAAKLQPLEEIAATGRSRADEITELYERTKGEPRALAAALKLS